MMRLFEIRWQTKKKSNPNALISFGRRRFSPKHQLFRRFELIVIKGNAKRIRNEWHFQSLNSQYHFAMEKNKQTKAKPSQHKLQSL